MNYLSSTVFPIFVIFLLNTVYHSIAGEITITSDILRKGVVPKEFGNPVEDDEAYATAYDGPPEDTRTAPGCPPRYEFCNISC